MTEGTLWTHDTSVGGLWQRTSTTQQCRPLKVNRCGPKYQKRRLLPEQGAEMVVIENVHELGVATR